MDLELVFEMNNDITTYKEGLLLQHFHYRYSKASRLHFIHKLDFAMIGIVFA